MVKRNRPMRGSKSVLLALSVLCSVAETGAAAASPSHPTLVGAMKEAMWNGRVEGLIDIDTIADKESVVGLGPMEYLRGEILLFDGKGYISEVRDDGAVKVTRTTKVKAPFFGYGRIKKWKREALPDSVNTLPEIERFFIAKKGMDSDPFLFKIEAVAEKGSLHVVNLPPGAKVRSPAEAHKGKRHYGIGNRDMILIGFFSTKHQSVFTHHDSYLHIHAISKDETIMGHLDEILIKPGNAWVSTPEE